MISAREIMHAVRINNNIAAILLTACLLGLWVNVPKAQAADFVITGGGDYNIRTTSWLDRRFRHVIRQEYDFSCGSAALATLLTYHYRMPIPEKKVLEAMFRAGDQAKIRKEGFSLLDMKKYLAAIGLRAEGFKDSLDKLVRVGIPAIALINYKGYLHFVVVKGVNKREVLISDPSYGTRTFPRKDFEERMWNNILFVITDKMDVARATFNRNTTWALKDRGRFSTPLVLNEISVYNLSIAPTPGYF